MARGYQGAGLDVEHSPTLSRKATVRPGGLAVALSVLLFGVMLFAIGCDTNGESAVSTSDDKPKKARTEPKRQASRQADIERKGPQRTGPHIPGMNADAVLATFLKPGLECWQPIKRGVLYLCSGEENENLALLYEGEVTGRATDQVSSVEARVSRRGAEDFDQASQPFLGLLATQLKYRGANKDQAYEFVNRIPSDGKATTTIGEATWTMTSSDDSRELTITPA